MLWGGICRAVPVLLVLHFCFGTHCRRMGDVLMLIITYILYTFQIPQMSSSQEDSDYESYLRSLDTSDDSASSSDSEYFSASEEDEEGGEERAWRSLELGEEHRSTVITGNPVITVDNNQAEMNHFEFFSLFY